MLEESVIEFLSQNKLFRGMTRDAIAALAKNMSLIHVTSGDYVMHEGDPASSMFLVYQGRLRVYASSSKQHVVAEIGVGAVVGEIALLTAMPRVADVRAVRDTTLIQIDQQTFQSWVQLHSDSAMKMVSDSIKRLLPPELGKGLHEVTTLVLLSASAGVSINIVAHALRKAIEPYKRCCVLNEEDNSVKQAIDNNEPVPLAYLNSCETTHDIVIYVATSCRSAWTEQCIRQADKLLMVMTQEETAPTDVIASIPQDDSILVEKFLLVLHPPETSMPQRSDFLMDITHADRVFHIKNEADYQRIGRFFTGHAVSLVLSGGGLRGAAHIGFYYALQAKGIPVDMVGGSSFGGLAAAAIGMQLPRDVADKMSSWVQKTLPRLMDYTIPMVSLLRGERLYELLTHVFSTTMLLEDLWIPTFCTATNMTLADIKTFDRGLAWKCIRASISLPGIFPPVVHDGHILVDGAMFNNLPVDIMRERNHGGKVIAVSVSTDLPHERYFAADKTVSGFDVFADRFRANPHTHLPSLLELLLNVEFVGAQKHMNQVKHMSDFFFDINVSEYDMLDLTHWDAIIEKGYERGCRLIDDAGLTRETLGILS